MSEFVVEVFAGLLLALATIALWRRFPALETVVAALLLVCAALFYPALGVLMGVPLSSMPLALSAVLVFLVLAWLGHAGSLWFLAIGWWAHGLWDLVIPVMEAVDHMPHWYAGLCIGFDIAIGSYFVLRALGTLDAPTSMGAAT
ncbi:MAG: hypothetical protein QNI86_12105 [Halieaceae bacterium]|nr:hypothetical protein [Halieaceae bacterium]